jgi:hypothetical protein
MANRVIRRFCPLDFAVAAADMSTHAICRRWLCDKKTAARWISEQCPQWQAQRTASVRDRIRASCRAIQALGVAGVQRKAAMRREGVAPKTDRELPHDFAEVGAQRAFTDLHHHYRASPRTLGRWIKSMPQAWRDARSAWIEAKAQESRNLYNQRRAAEAAIVRAAREQERLAERARRDVQRAAERAKRQAERELGRAKAATSTPHNRVRAAGRAGPAIFRMKPMSAIVTAAPVGIAPMAANFLRRRIVPVYNARKAVTGGEYGDIWIVGKRKMTTEQMIDLARVEGWNPDGWRTVMPASAKGALA